MNVRTAIESLSVKLGALLLSLAVMHFVNMFVFHRIRRRAVRHVEKGRVVISAAGTGTPFFTTDTAAALRAAEIDADAILRGTHSGVDGIYTDDPKTNPDATLIPEVGYMEVLERGLRAMDSTAITLCMDNAVPIVVFDLLGPGNIRSILEGKPIGTLVS